MITSCSISMIFDFFEYPEQADDQIEAIECETNGFERHKGELAIA